MPTRLVNLTTATGVFPSTGSANFGDAYRHAAFTWNNPSTRAIEGAVEGSVGQSDNWVTVITLATGTTTGAMLSSSGASGLAVFDKLRIDLSGNESTSATVAWLAASH